MEDLLLALHGAQRIKIIGELFSGTSSQDFENCIFTKCHSVLAHFKNTNYDTMKTSFDNEV